MSHESFYICNMSPFYIILYTGCFFQIHVGTARTASATHTVFVGHSLVKVSVSTLDGTCAVLCVGHLTAWCGIMLEIELQRWIS